MQIVPVNSSSTRRQFLELPLKIYDDQSKWIRPLDGDIEEVFDPNQNKFFRKGEAQRWVLKRDSGEVIGRVAAFYNENRVKKKGEPPAGGMGFFECIEDKEAAFRLFDKCKEWLEERGLEAMDGPINFGERDRWWGLLVEGFDREPNYRCNYNPPYYKKFFEDYSFKVYFKQYTYYRPVQEELSEKIKQKAHRIRRNKDYHFDYIEKNNLERYAKEFTTVYNKAWSNHKGVNKMSAKIALKLMQQMKPVMDEEIVWFGYYKDEPIAFFIMLPELNQLFKHVNGKMNWWGKLKFLWHQWRGTCRKMFGVVFGVIPEHQGLGLEGAIAKAAGDYIQPLNRYDDMELNWIGDFNPKMMRVAESIGARQVKTHHTYRKLFDENQTFERAPIID